MCGRRRSRQPFQSAIRFWSMAGAGRSTGSRLMLVETFSPATQSTGWLVLNEEQASASRGYLQNSLRGERPADPAIRQVLPQAKERGDAHIPDQAFTRTAELTSSPEASITAVPWLHPLSEPTSAQLLDTTEAGNATRSYSVEPRRAKAQGRLVVEMPSTRHFTGRSDRIRTCDLFVPKQYG